jgi:hypothetical protein
MTTELVGRPITPQEVAGAKCTYTPPAVFDAFNIEIAQRYSVGRAIVPQNAVIARLVNGGMKRSEIFDGGWLNVEEAYQAVGWKVSYTKPAYNESGDSYFEFSR